MRLRPFVLSVGLAGAFAAWSMAGSERPPVAEASPVAQGEAQPPGIELTVGDPLPREIKGIRDADPGDRKVDAALDRIVTLRCQNVRLADLVTRLEQAAGIPIRQLPKEEVENLVDFETRVSIEVFEVPLSRALDELMLQDIGYLIEKGKLVLYVDENGCGGRLHTRLYSIALLKTLRADEIMDEVLSQTSGPWDMDEPGSGTINLVGDHLVISQDRKNHGQVEGVLNLLLEAEIERLPPDRQPRPKPPEAAPAQGGFFGQPGFFGMKKE